MATLVDETPSGPLDPAEDEPVGRGRPPRLRGDLIAVAVAAVLVTAASLIGWALIRDGVDVLVGWPPLLAQWLPHVGPGTVPAIVLALLVALRGPEAARVLPWRPLLWVALLASVAWTLALAMIDGWFRGIAERLATDTEYLAEVPLRTSVTEFLTTFADRIPSLQVDSLVTHASGHPPLATLFYMGLDAIGLGGGDWAGIVTLVVAASAVVPVAITLAAVGDEGTARRYLPFGVLFPGAVWMGVSADGMFAAVFAWGVALFALGATRRGPGGYASCLAGGVVLGAALFLSYGLVLGGLLPVVVALIAARWRAPVPLLAGAIGAGVVVALFAFGGFWWFDGYEMVKVRYYQPGEFGLLRPYGYWVWANLAAVVLAVGPATVAGVRRLAWRPRGVPLAVLALAGAGLVAIIAADLSGLSKSEVERIWLPFAVWVMTATAVLPRASARWWLLAQGTLALVVNHLLLTVW